MATLNERGILSIFQFAFQRALVVDNFDLIDFYKKYGRQISKYQHCGLDKILEFTHEEEKFLFLAGWFGSKESFLVRCFFSGFLVLK